MDATPSQASVAVAVPVFAGRVDEPQAICISAGQVMMGAVLSIKLSCPLALAVQPFLSVTTTEYVPCERLLIHEAVPEGDH
jgi:hypothetical protein